MESMARVFTDRGKVKKFLHQHYRMLNVIRNYSPDKARERTFDRLNYVESELKAFRNQKRSS